MSDKHQCCARVTNETGWHDHQCIRNGKVERDGKWYCGQHDPIAVEQRDRKRRDIWRLEAAAIDARHALNGCLGQIIDRIMSGEDIDCGAVRTEYGALLKDKADAEAALRAAKG